MSRSFRGRFAGLNARDAQINRKADAARKIAQAVASVPAARQSAAESNAIERGRLLRLLHSTDGEK